jgi:hypothetical protein
VLQARPKHELRAGGGVESNLKHHFGLGACPFYKPRAINEHDVKASANDMISAVGIGKRCMRRKLVRWICSPM